MKNYVGTVQANVIRMNRGNYNLNRGWEIPQDENSLDDGYMMETSNGHITWIPKDVFDNTYSETSNVRMTFGKALESLKLGSKVAREGWNGKGMFVYLVPEGVYYSRTDAAKSIGAVVTYEPYFAILNVRGTVNTWVPSVADCLAEDWTTV